MKFLINLMLYGFLYVLVLFPLFDWLIADYIHWNRNINEDELFAELGI